MLIILFKGLNKKCFSDLIITISSLVSILDDEAITIRDEGGQQQRTKTILETEEEAKEALFFY